MGYLIFCTFDLKGASSQDYEDAYADLAELGLVKVHKSDRGTDVVVPTTAAMGTAVGSMPYNAASEIRNKIQMAFKARNLKSEIFVVGGENWEWAGGIT